MKTRFLCSGVALTIIVLLVFTSCGGGARGGSAPQDAGSTSISKNFYVDVSRIDGSTATIPLSEAVLKKLYGSSEGLVQNTTDIAYWYLINKDKDVIFVTEPSKEELASAADAGVELEVVPVVKDALVFLANSKNPVKGLTQNQIRDIYTGKITNWREAGGADTAIVPFQRPVGSGSQTLFLSLAMKGAEPMNAPSEIRPSTMVGLIDQVANYDNKADAIGYSVFYYASEMYQRNEVKLLSIDNVMPTKETIAKGSYPYLTYYYAVFRKDEPKDSSVRALVNWMLSNEGQRVAAAAGYVPLAPENEADSPDNYGFFGSTPENTTKSSGTGGTKPLPLPPSKGTDSYGGQQPLLTGDTNKLSSLFYDGVNYVDYINRSIIEQSETSDSWGQIGMARPFTGIPNDYPLFDLMPPEGNYSKDSCGAALRIRFNAANPFFIMSGEGQTVSEVPFQINLPLDLSPYGSVWKIDYQKKESSRHTGVMVPQVTTCYLKKSAADAKINAGILAWYEKAETSGVFDGITSFGASENIEPNIEALHGKLIVTYPLDQAYGTDVPPRSPVTAAFDLKTGDGIALPAFPDAAASSARASMGANSYDPARAIDGDTATAWCEGVPGPGTGEWIELQAASKQRVDQISLINGYAKSNQAYADNNRVKTCTITGEGGFEKQVQLSDNNSRYQTISLEAPIYTSWLRFTITDVYPGAADSEDTLVSEIRAE
ncbi:MAG: substrate-binding domain-containing protein [Clostridiales bacterium]|nr:substrate-binding domain-containing protein [Clostridiales bacterium]